MAGAQESSGDSVGGARRCVKVRANTGPLTGKGNFQQRPHPWPIHRDRRGWPKWYQRWLEAWWIITGRWSLHRAWQAGHEHGTDMEYRRTVIMGGR